MNQLPLQQEDDDFTDDQQTQIPRLRQSTHYAFYKCSYCSKLFKKPQDLGGHVQKIHKMERNRSKKEKRKTRQRIEQHQ